MLYSSLPMGEEAYYLFIDADRSAISAEDLSSCNGKRIGVNEGSIQAKLFRDWMERYDLSPVVVELQEDEAASMRMLASGELDGYVSLDNISSAEEVTSVCKIGESEYYFTVNKDRPDLLSELNSAMAQILSEDPLYGKKLEETYVHFTQTNAYLPAAQSHWLEKHGTIRVGYRCDYLPYCAVDEKTGELTGALRDYLTKASTSLKNADIDFEAVPYPTTNDALEALKNGEVDCAFPVNLSSHDCELEDIVTVSPIMMAGMNALMRSEDRPKLGPGRQLTVAINEGNRNYETFLKDSVPDWTVQTYDTGLDCLRAVYQKEADCTLISNYRMNDVIRLIDRYKLVSLPTGETMGLSLAVRRTDQELYSILNKIANNTPAEDMEYALLDYIHSDQKVSLSDFLQDNWLLTTGFITAVFLVILLLLNDKLKAERRAHIQRLKKEAALNRAQRQREQLRSAMDMAYTDPLTRVKSKHAFLDAEERMNQRIEQGRAPEFAVVMFDVNDLKKMNDTLGHENGDRFLQNACELICVRFRNSPVFRIGGDEFVAILEGLDFERRDELLTAFDAQMEEHRRHGGIVISSGLALFRPGEDRNIQDVLERADKTMYRHKRQLKELEPD